MVPAYGVNSPCAAFGTAGYKAAMNKFPTAAGKCDASPANSGNPGPAPLLVSSRVAAKMLCMSQRSLYTLRTKGKIPYCREPKGSIVRYAVADLQAFIARITVRDIPAQAVKIAA
jgi:hypothetical protein